MGEQSIGCMDVKMDGWMDGWGRRQMLWFRESGRTLSKGCPCILLVEFVHVDSH